MTAKYLPITPLAWMSDAVCAQVDPDLWFPEKGGPVQAAKSICEQCPAKLLCLQYSLDNNETIGVWGGLTRQERRKLKVSAA